MPQAMHGYSGAIMGVCQVNDSFSNCFNHFLDTENIVLGNSFKNSSLYPMNKTYLIFDAFSHNNTDNQFKYWAICIIYSTH